MVFTLDNHPFTIDEVAELIADCRDSICNAQKTAEAAKSGPVNLRTLREISKAALLGYNEALEAAKATVSDQVYADGILNQEKLNALGIEHDRRSTILSEVCRLTAEAAKAGEQLDYRTEFNTLYGSGVSADDLLAQMAQEMGLVVIDVAQEAKTITAETSKPPLQITKTI